jgi:hypothetical protein
VRLASIEATHHLREGFRFDERGEVADNIWLAASPGRSNLKTLWAAGRHVISHAAILTEGGLDHVNVVTEASTTPLRDEGEDRPTFYRHSA